MTASNFLDDIMLRASRGMGRTSVGGGNGARAERIWRSLSGANSAIVKRIAGAGVQHSKQLAGQMAYVNGKAKGVFGYAPWVVEGDDAFDQDAIDNLIATWSKDWNGRPRNGHTSHMVLSFADDVSNDAALSISRQFCEEMFESQTHVNDSWEYIAALHTDTANPHVHIILNNKGIDGTWFSISQEGDFNPQMMRDRMTYIADQHGVRLESTTRADRGLYGPAITAAEVHAARDGRTISKPEVIDSVTAEWRRDDMRRTAELYTTLADFAETIGAPILAKRAHISAAALFAGEEVPKGQMMTIDLDVTADRNDIRTSLIGWADQNKEALEALPVAEKRTIMAKIEAALDIIETGKAAELPNENLWVGYSEAPSSYLIPDVAAVQQRAEIYVDQDKTAVLQKFKDEKVLDTYLVTGKVPKEFETVLPAVEQAYSEMHNHKLSDISAEMQSYVTSASHAGVDARKFEQRLIAAISSPLTNEQYDRESVFEIAEKQGIAKDLRDAELKEYTATMAKVLPAIEANVDGTKPIEEDMFWQVMINKRAMDGLEKGDDQMKRDLMGQLHSITTPEGYDKLSANGKKMADAVVPYIIHEHADYLISGYDRVEVGFAEEVGTLETAKVERQLREEARDMLAAMKERYPTPEQRAIDKATQKYQELQLELGGVEERTIASSKVYSREGVVSVMQSVADTAARTGKADFENSLAGKQMLLAFVALEGRGAMQQVAAGDMKPLESYLDTPAKQRLAAKELLKSAKSVDVGLSRDQIETGLEAVDPTYSRSVGYSI